MLDIFKNIPGLRQADQEAKQEEAEKKVNPYPNGPVTYKVPTNGQLRRAAVRRQRTAERKRIQKLRRQHWALRQEVAVLQARLVAVGNLPNGYGEIVTTVSEKAEKALVEQYGSVEDARKRLDAIFGVNQDA